MLGVEYQNQGPPGAYVYYNNQYPKPQSRTRIDLERIPYPGDWCTITYYENDVQVSLNMKS